MRKLLFLIFIMSMSSCEDVIEIDTPVEAPRLIIDALVRVDLNSTSSNVRVKVSETNSFFGQTTPAGLQQITLVNFETNVVEVLNEEEPGSGIYSKILGNAYLTSGEILLTVTFEDEFFLAYATFVPAATINSITQGDNTLFDEDETEVIVNFTDNEDRTDFYLFDFDFNNYLATEDTFYQGQAFEFSYFFDENLEPGDALEISIMGIDEPFYNYMNLLIEQSEGGGFGAFDTPSITVRGNVFNVTDIDNIDTSNNVNNSNNFALGYFAIVEERKEILIIE